MIHVPEQVSCWVARVCWTEELEQGQVGELGRLREQGLKENKCSTSWGAREERGAGKLC